MKNLNEQVGRIKSMMGLIMEQSAQPQCNNAGCSGTYSGPEFQNGIDVAHKYSNIMANAVGMKLKQLYDSGTYVKVDLDNIKMSATSVNNGENSNPTVVKITIPFVKVSDKCDAYTSFDHVGGWGHTPELGRRKSELSSALIPGETFDISQEKNTNLRSPNFPDGSLNEYWIQWKEKTRQSDCAGLSTKQVTITGNSVNNLRDNLKTKTSGATIDLNTVKININSLNVTYNTGNTKIQNMSLIFDDQGQLENRLPSIRKNNPTMIEKPEWKGKVGNLDWIFVVIK